MIANNFFVNESTVFDREIDKLINTYSVNDQEQFSNEVLDILQNSNLVKILDENNKFGPGGLSDVLKVCKKVAKTDASLAWIIGVSNSGWSMQSCFNALINEGNNNLLAMVLGRPGVLRKDKKTGDYLLSGEWRNASGWQYAKTFFCLAALEDTNPKEVYVIAVPAEQLELCAPWRATGMRATQSVGVKANDLRITENQKENYLKILSGANKDHSTKNQTKKKASYTGLFTGVLMNCLLGSVLGSTEAALDYVIAESNTRPVAGSSYQTMNDSGAIRAEIGRLCSALDIYTRAAESNATIIDQAARDPNTNLTTQDRVNVRARATYIMRGCVEIVQDILWIYGSAGLDKGHFLEKIWRDVNVGARHGGFTKFIPEEAVGLSVTGHKPQELTKMF